MLLIRVTTEDGKGAEVTAGYVPQGFDTEQAAKARIAELQETYDRLGYEDRPARWWAKNDDRSEITYWWIEYPS